MTINEIIEAVCATRPHGYNEDKVRGFIEECDKRIYRTIVEQYEPNEGEEIAPYEERYPLSTDGKLLADEAFHMLYVWYAICQADIFSAEYERYVNDLMIFKDYWDEFEKYYARTHKKKASVTRYITD